MIDSCAGLICICIHDLTDDFMPDSRGAHTGSLKKEQCMNSFSYSDRTRRTGREIKSLNQESIQEPRIVTVAYEFICYLLVISRSQKFLYNIHRDDSPTNHVYFMSAPHRTRIHTPRYAL